eukprot:TRINITY_DN12464_c0_g1_i2.p1 TRINITY_DN12464_c0_g1~~TRINITY_DN12464_c0_g1_i2.p1  ORF type:complete len:194 (+),score=30.83 TRINITY_DN12464_c0_g1_i2:51-632(+)
MAFDECCFCGGKDEEGVDFKEWSPCKGSTSVAPTRLTTAFSGLVPCSRGNEAVTANLAKEERLMFGHTDHADHAEKSSICITLKKVRGSKLGVDVDLSDGETMLVEKVMDGLVLDWNKSRDTSQRPHCLRERSCERFSADGGCLLKGRDTRSNARAYQRCWRMTDMVGRALVVRRRGDFRANFLRQRPALCVQ